jgi:putative transposase
MNQTKNQPQAQKPLPTIWCIPDPLWELLHALIVEFDPPKRRGRKPIDPRRILDTLIFRLRSGCQWNHLPKELADDSTAHRRFQKWRALGLFDRLWATLVEHCHALKEVQWEWQAADGAMGKARMGGDHIGPNPTDRAKPGTKRSLLVDGQGGPLSIVTAGANVHDTKLLRATLEAIIVERPVPTKRKPQNLCLDKGYDNPTGRAAVEGLGYKVHLRRIGEEPTPRSRRTHPPRRWVVERTFGWLNKCRAILVRYDKKVENYLALLKLACALLWYRRCVGLAF